jgi:hypothetical protein
MKYVVISVDRNINLLLSIVLGALSEPKVAKVHLLASQTLSARLFFSPHVATSEPLKAFSRNVITSGIITFCRHTPVLVEIGQQ